VRLGSRFISMGFVLLGCGVISSAEAHPGKKLIEGFLQGSLATTANAVVLRCVEGGARIEQPQGGVTSQSARDAITSGMTGLAYLNLSSGVRPVMISGLGFAGMSVWGNYLAVKKMAKWSSLDQPVRPTPEMAPASPTPQTPRSLSGRWNENAEGVTPLMLDDMSLIWCWLDSPPLPRGELEEETQRVEVEAQVESGLEAEHRENELP
jgi:hypothetical protein